MKITAGSFGVRGRAQIVDNKHLVIDGERRADYSSEQVKAVNARIDKERKFSALSFIIGALLFCTIFGIFFSLIGVIIGFVLATVGSFYTTKSNMVEVSFTDGLGVTLECSRREVTKLYAFQRGV